MMMILLVMMIVMMIVMMNATTTTRRGDDDRRAARVLVEARLAAGQIADLRNRRVNGQQAPACAGVGACAMRQ